MLRLQFCVSGSAIESASKHSYWAHADSIWKLETQNCSCVFFKQGHSTDFCCWNLPSHNSCLKNVSIKYHHIFWKVYPGYFRKFPIWDKCVLVHYGSFSQEINGKSAKFAVWAVSLIFLFDFTLFVIDIHQIMLISPFPTPFDHFYFHPTLGLKWTH